MTSSIHEISDNMEGHEKQEQRDSQIQVPMTIGRISESIATSLVQLPHSMAPGDYPYPDPYYRSIFTPPCVTQAYPPRPYAGPYLHESRHLHAIRRPRGCGGRFLNAKKDDEHHEDNNENNSSLRSTKPAMAASGGTA